MTHQIQALKDDCRSLWAKACRHDGIDPKSPFVTFSTANPHVPVYNKKMADLTAARKLQTRTVPVW